MARIFKKSHFWEDKVTFIDMLSEMPFINDKGYPKEGSLNIRIGGSEGIKAGFKLTIDEAAQLRNILDLFLLEHNKKLMELYGKAEDKLPQKRYKEEQEPLFKSANQ